MELFQSRFVKRMTFISVMACFMYPAHAQTYTGESSSRITVNMGETPWKFLKSDAFNGTPSAKDSAYNDQSWKEVGVPHCYNDVDTWRNAGNGFSDTYIGTASYRKFFFIPASYSGRRIEIEFQGANFGCAVYINGIFKPNITKVQQPNNGTRITHINGHLPFVIDITNDVKYGAQNLIAIWICNSWENWERYTLCAIGCSGDNGTSYGGLHRPVYMHITDKVHVPLNVYSNIRRWGTYVATTAATDASATVRLQTNVYNDGTQSKEVTVTTKIVDAKTNTVVAIQTTSPQTIAAGANYVFDQTATIANPRLWYPNNSIHGKPNMHKVYHIVQVGGQTVDVSTSPLGIRVITWDSDFAYINGKKHVFWGFGSRYEYPGFSSAIPEEQQWRDVKLMAECGGSMLRPGHVPIATATVEACDAYGVALFENTMDKEWAIRSATTIAYKDEFHRDCIIRDRNHPSLVVWELTNGSYEGEWVHGTGWIKRMIDTIKLYDPITPRAASPRDSTDYWPATQGELIIGTNMPYRRKTTRLPVWGAESWFRGQARFSYDYEVQHTDHFIEEYHKSITTKAAGTTHWMFADCGGENYGYWLDPAYSSNGSMRKTLGASAMDHLRIPKHIYHVYKNAAFVPYEIRPGVALPSQWNKGTKDTLVSVYSNCPKVELFLNGISQGIKTPDTATKTDWINNATVYTKSRTRCQWKLKFTPGTLRAEGKDAAGKTVCFDERKTAGTPKKIVLTVEPAITRPDNGSVFSIRPNGTDATFILATIVDSAGNWCPLANNNITFTVSGQGTYVGAANFFADLSKPGTYHAPGDPELAAEGGMMKIGVRATFTQGTITVGATSPGLTAAVTTYATGTKPTIASLQPLVLSAGNKTFKTTGTMFIVPKEFSGKAVSIKIYDLSGKLLWNKIVKTKRVSFAKYGTNAVGMYIVRCREVRPAECK